MADFNELQARALLDSCLALHREGFAKSVTSSSFAILRVDGVETPLAVRFEVDANGALETIEIGNGPEAITDLQRFALSCASLGETPIWEFSSLRIELIPIAQAPPEALEIFRLARSPHPREAIVPHLVARGAKGAGRRANQAERKLLLRVAVALARLAPRAAEVFRDAVGGEPPREIVVTGSPLKPSLEIVARPDCAWWTLLDLRRAFGEHRAPPELARGPGAWRIDVIPLDEIDDHGHGHGHEHEHEHGHGAVKDAPGILVIGDAREKRLIGSLIAARRDIPAVLDCIGRLLRELDAAGEVRSLPARIECDGIAPEPLRRFLGADSIEVVAEGPSAAYREFLAANRNELLARATATEIDARLRAPVRDYQWFDCEMALVEAFGAYLDTLDPAALGAISRRYCGVDDWLADALEDSSILETVTAWRLAFHPEDDAAWIPSADPADPERNAGARTFTATLREAKTRIRRIARVVDQERVALVDVLTGESTIAYALDLADPSFVNGIVFGRVLRLGDATLHVTFSPCIEPAIFRALLQSMPALGLQVTAAGVRGDEHVGRIRTWLESAGDALDDAPPYEEDDIEAHDPAARATERLREYLVNPSTTIDGLPLPAAKSTLDGLARIQALIGAFPALVLDDDEIVEPDRTRAAAVLDVPYPAR